jgi:AraC-like DNA-binding protein
MLQVALACGFGNQSHFNRVFRKIAGVTPGEYRKSVFG